MGPKLSKGRSIRGFKKYGKSKNCQRNDQERSIAGKEENVKEGQECTMNRREKRKLSPSISVGSGGDRLRKK